MRELTHDQKEFIRSVLNEVRAERHAQHARWGEQNHPDGTGGVGSEDVARLRKTACDEAFDNGQGTWRHILAEEVAEAFAESQPGKLRAELIQVAAIAVQWIEAIDRRK